jgi:hypothetical protein
MSVDIHESSTFVVVQNDCDYTNSGCRVVGVHATLERATRGGWLLLVEQACMPWNLDRYARKAFVRASDFHVEEWDSASSELRGVWRLGWGVVRNHRVGLIDERLVGIATGGTGVLHATLNWWRAELAAGRTPHALAELEAGVAAESKDTQG